MAASGAAVDSPAACALYAPLALVGATSQVIDMGSLAAAGSSQPQQQSSLAIVTVTSSSPCASPAGAQPAPSPEQLLVCQSAEGRPETRLARRDSVKSSGSANSLAAIQRPQAAPDRLPVAKPRAILRNRLGAPPVGAQLRLSAEELPVGGEGPAGRQRLASAGQRPVAGETVSTDTLRQGSSNTLEG